MDLPPTRFSGAEAAGSWCRARELTRKPAFPPALRLALPQGWSWGPQEGSFPLSDLIAAQVLLGQGRKGVPRALVHQPVGPSLASWMPLPCGRQCQEQRRCPGATVSPVSGQGTRLWRLPA